MKIAEKYKVREMAGEHIIVMPGTYGADMTRVISLNATSLYLWQELQGREFEVADVVALLVEHYDVDAATAERDAAAWMEQLRSCGVVE
ncbi:MAG: PqqD family protein [Alistipes sp.]|nr:PqqD family protein [Rikenellaceae bacterium]MBO5188626.1 PqqD family protein [Alistipes sp.]MBQ2727701.1 PqqD family protein [Alistipes sp.]MBQ3082875.1 PqqD family protein [Alistipes sp.]MBQ8470536.1 PqqD family protein [Alistipes sp.]